MKVNSITSILSLGLLQAMQASASPVTDIEAREPMVELESRVSSAPKATIGTYGLASGGGSPGSPACSPYCRILFGSGTAPWKGCSSKEYAEAEFVGDCHQVFTNGAKSIGIDGCKGFHVYVEKSAGNAAAAIVSDASGKNIADYGFTCSTPKQGGQCTFTNNVCDVIVGVEF